MTAAAARAGGQSKTPHNTNDHTMQRTTEVRALVDQVREECKARGNYVTIRYFRRHKEVGRAGMPEVDMCVCVEACVLVCVLLGGGQCGAI